MDRWDADDRRRPPRERHDVVDHGPDDVPADARAPRRRARAAAGADAADDRARRRAVPDRLEAAHDRLARPDLPRVLRHERGRHDARVDRGLARPARHRRPTRDVGQASSSSTTTATAARPTPRAASTSRAAAAASATTAIPTRPSPRTAATAFTAGDIGWVDDDGYLYISGRRADVIVSAGVNIYPAEIETELERRPRRRRPLRGRRARRRSRRDAGGGRGDRRRVTTPTP